MCDEKHDCDGCVQDNKGVPDGWDEWPGAGSKFPRLRKWVSRGMCKLAGEALMDLEHEREGHRNAVKHWNRVAKERDALRGVIEELLAASDDMLGTSWRDDTLGQGVNGDRLNAAWDALVEVLRETDENN